MIRKPGPGRRRSAQPWTVIVISLLALAMMLIRAPLDDSAVDAWIRFWGFRPGEVLGQLAELAAGRPDPGLARLFTALFAHSTWLHLAGNLAYLWVFGIPVERAVGHLRFVTVFLVFGALANLFVSLQIPMLERSVIGASGGVSAVVGAYLGLFPSRRIGLWLPLGLYLQFARIPALLVIGSWFTLQILYTVFGPISGAVAWWTHVAGFVAGLVLALAWRLRPERIVVYSEE